MLVYRSVHITKVVLISIFLFIFFECHAQQQAFSLKESIKYALENSYSIQKEKLDRAGMRYTMKEEKSGSLPQINAYANYLQYFELPTYIFPEEEGLILSGGESNDAFPVELGREFNLFTGVELKQSLFDKRWLTGPEIKNVSQSLSDLKMRKSEEEVIFNVASAFYQISSNQEQLETINFTLQNLDSLEDIVALQFKNDLVKKTDWTKIKIKISSLKTQQHKLVSGIGQQKNFLKFLMGMPVSEELILEEGDFEIDPDLPVEELPDFETFTQSQLMEKQKELQLLEKKNIQAGYYPKMNAFANFQYQAQRDEFNFLDGDEEWFPVHLLGVSLDIPIFKGFEKKAKLGQSEVKMAKIKLQQEQSRQQLAMEYQNALNELETALLSIREQEQNKALTEDEFLQTKLEYKEGITLLSDLLTSENTLREANRLYQSALLDYKMARLKMLKAQGRLKELLN